MSTQATTVIRKFYDNFEEILSVTCVGVMVACLMLQVGARWVTGAGIPWTEELSRFSFLWAVFASAALVAKHGTHVRITAQYLLMPPQVASGLQGLHRRPLGHFQFLHRLDQLERRLQRA